MHAANLFRARARQTSGPMPAGSPEVTAMIGTDFERGEVPTVDDAFPQGEQFPLGLVLGNEIVGTYQNMTYVGLLHEEGRTGAAQLEELEHVESGGASKHLADVSWLQARQGLDVQF